MSLRCWDGQRLRAEDVKRRGRVADFVVDQRVLHGGVTEGLVGQWSGSLWIVENDETLAPALGAAAHLFGEERRRRGVGIVVGDHAVATHPDPVPPAAFLVAHRSEERRVGK